MCKSQESKKDMMFFEKYKYFTFFFFLKCVGSLSLLQGIFVTQELNWSLFHCRRILHQLSHQGSPVEEGAPI